jgi:hypothetical protein
VFLAEMAAVVPWSVLEAIIDPRYPKVGRQGGRRPFLGCLESMEASCHVRAETP